MNDEQAEKFYAVVAAIAAKIERPQDEANIAAWLSDETDADDVEALANSYKLHVADRIADKLTDEDIAARHAGETTGHVLEIVNQYGTFQVWGSRTGSEPLSIVYPA